MSDTRDDGRGWVFGVVGAVVLGTLVASGSTIAGSARGSTVRPGPRLRPAPVPDVPDDASPGSEADRRRDRIALAGAATRWMSEPGVWTKPGTKSMDAARVRFQTVLDDLRWHIQDPAEQLRLARILFRDHPTADERVFLAKAEQTVRDPWRFGPPAGNAIWRAGDGIPTYLLRRIERRGAKGDADRIARACHVLERLIVWLIDEPTLQRVVTHVETWPWAGP